MKLEDLFEFSDPSGKYTSKTKSGDKKPPTDTNAENETMDETPPPGELGEFISSAQAAKILGVSMSRVRQFVGDGRLKSYGPEKGRRDHIFKIGEVKAMAKKERKITGRPSEGKGT